MPKSINSEYELNFPDAAQRKFNKLCAFENWSWYGLAFAIIKRFGISNAEEFHFILGETIKKLKD